MKLHIFLRAVATLIVLILLLGFWNLISLIVNLPSTLLFGVSLGALFVTTYLGASLITWLWKPVVSHLWEIIKEMRKKCEKPTS